MLKNRTMSLIGSLMAIALLACAVPLGLWYFKFGHLELANNSIEWSNFGGYIGGVLSPPLAFVGFIGLLLTLHFQRAQAARLDTESNDRNYFNHAVNSLERSFNAITGGKPDGDLSVDRLAWLTCARLLLSAKDVSGRISTTSEGLRALYEGEEEYWRHRFYELFEAKDVRVDSKKAGFFGSDTPSGAFRLEERSIRVIFEFKDWPEGKPDPIENVPKYESDELEAMKGSMSGVRDYVLTMPRFKKKPAA